MKGKIIFTHHSFTVKNPEAIMSIYNVISFGAHSEDYNGVSQQVANGDTIHMPSTVKRAVFLYYVLNILRTKKHVELFISNIIV